MRLFSALQKIQRRKKRWGFYEGADVLTYKEKESLFITALLITLPLLIACIMIVIN